MLENKDYHPELAPRRTELLAWLAGIGLMSGLIFADRQMGGLSGPYWIFAWIILLVAMSISLGNWMDRRSSIHLGTDGMTFKNGLRSVNLTWSEIQTVAVIPTRMGDRVEVQGRQSHFAFKTLWQSGLGGEEWRTGYIDGKKILDVIIAKSGLGIKSKDSGVVYYARP